MGAPKQHTTQSQGRRTALSFSIACFLFMRYTSLRQKGDVNRTFAVLVFVQIRQPKQAARCLWSCWVLVYYTHREKARGRESTLTTMVMHHHKYAFSALPSLPSPSLGPNTPSPLCLTHTHTHPKTHNRHYEILVFSPRVFPYVSSAVKASSSSATRALRFASIPSTSSAGTDSGSSGDTFKLRGGPNEKA